MVEYSGKVTFEHPVGIGLTAEEARQKAPECLRQVTLFDVQWSNCPVEVEDEVRQLWRDREYGNDHYFAWWDPDDDAERYPVIAEYLTSRGANHGNLLIWWWW